MNYETAHKLFTYDPETGELRNRTNRQRARVGALSGAMNIDGYRRVEVKNKTYLAHRLIWLLQYKEFPPNQIDHIDGDRSNNRLINLRNVLPVENSLNQKKYKNNKSGVAGVYWDESEGKWHAQINSPDGQKRLGRTKDFFEACCLRKAAENEYNYHPNHGRI